ncbi:MAG: HD domain-containing protein [Cyclonatronaceae bacterium]
MPHRRVAAIDLGTNSFHAVIADIQADGSYRTTDSLKEMIHLGRNGVGQPLSEEDRRRGLDALRKIKRLCEHQNVDSIVAYATSAIREAPNGGEFVQEVIDELDIKIQPIPGFKEAELIGHAVMHGMALEETPGLVMDIGGGSTEFVIVDRHEVLHTVSRKIGVSRMSSDFVKHDPIKKKEITALREYYKKQLSVLSGPVSTYKPDILIGSSGTMQNIAAMIAKRNNEHVDITLNEFEYSAEDFRAFYEEFIKLNKKQRLKTKGLDEKRVDFIVPGLVLLDYVLEKFDIRRIKTSEQAMREGIIIEYIKNELKALRMLEKYPDTRRRSVFELLKKYEWHKVHSTHVKLLALKIFDDTQPVHQLTPGDRELLEYASLMHDIGYHISQKKHHKHSLYIILNSNLKGFTQEEIEVMAHVARYHRRSTPKSRHSLFNSLTDEQQRKVRYLGGILRVADGLDRSHYQNVISIQSRLVENKEGGHDMDLSITTLADPELEIWGANRKKEMFEEMLGGRLHITSANYPSHPAETAPVPAEADA